MQKSEKEKEEEEEEESMQELMMDHQETVTSKLNRL